MLINSMFIKTLQIENYKGISKIMLKPKKINIFVGKNNTGKTSVLEAIELLVHPERLRRNLTSYFNIYSNERSINISAQTDKKEIDLTIKEAKEIELINKFSQDLISVFLEYLSEVSKIKYPSTIKQELENYTLKYIDEELKKYLLRNSLVLSDGKKENIIYYINYSMGEKITGIVEHIANYMLETIIPVGEKKEFSKYLESVPKYVRYSFDESLGRLKKPSNEKSEVLMIRSLLIDEVRSPLMRRSPEDSERMHKIAKIVKDHNLINNLEGLDSDNALYATNDGIKGHPFEFLGDGFKSIIGLLWRLSSDRASHSVLLLDEPENHMHPGYVKELIKFIIDFSKKLEIQIFITTHSLDVLDIILSNEELEKEEQKYLHDELVIFRMNKIGDSTTVANAFDYEEAKETKKDLLLDLRGV